MNVKSSLIVLLISISLSGCGLFKCKDDRNVNTTPITKPKLNIESPPPLKPSKVQWYVITPETSSDVFGDLTKKKTDLALFGLTDDGYESLSMNIAELRKYIIQQSEIIAAYKKYYEGKQDAN